MGKDKQKGHVVLVWTDELTHRLFFICVHTLGNQNFIEPVIGHLQHEAAIHHTVPGFEPPVDDVPIVQVLHPLSNHLIKADV